jgi:stage II sporulation protein D
MFKAFNTVLKSLRVWHIAPLFLPLLLGSTNVRVFPAASAFQGTIPPVPTNVLIDRELAKFRQSQPLPSQVLSTFPGRTHSKPIASGRTASGRNDSQTSQKIAAARQSQPKPQAVRQKSPTAAPQASLASMAAPQPAHNLPPIPLRVAIALNTKTLDIATSDNGVVVDQSGRILGQLTAQAGITASPTPGGLQVGEWQTPSVVWIKPQTAGGLVFLNGHWYRGSVQIVAQPEGLLAVNHVDLESYLYSVVGSEMPASWPTEALKSQAITARSYALVHMARNGNELYDLGATPRWQAYNGAESETNTTQTAVNATKGILLSYQGGVVESLYASSIDIVREVHGGFGMSQEGANQLAQQGFKYQQILGYFYPKTNLAVLNIR